MNKQSFALTVHVNSSVNEASRSEIQKSISKEYGKSMLSDSPELADIVITSSIEQSLDVLKEGRYVALHTPTLGESASGLRSNFPRQFRETFSLGVVDQLMNAVHLFHQNETEKPIRKPLPEVRSTRLVEDTSILIVDDSYRHRYSARAQLEECNDLRIVSSYDEALMLLDHTKFGVVATTLMMPTESSNLDREEKGKLTGNPFPAGLFVGMKALQKGNNHVLILAEGNHYRDPCFVALDYLPVFSDLSYDLRFAINKEPPKIMGMKDWESAIYDLLNENSRF